MHVCCSVDSAQVKKRRKYYKKKKKALRVKRWWRFGESGWYHHTLPEKPPSSNFFLCASVSPPVKWDLSNFPFSKSHEHVVSGKLLVMQWEQKKKCKRVHCIFLHINWKSVLFGKRIIFLSYHPTATQSSSLSNTMSDATFTNAENKTERTDSKGVSSAHAHTVICFSSELGLMQSKTDFWNNLILINILHSSWKPFPPCCIPHCQKIFYSFQAEFKRKNS